ncbi:MAG: hypothetical protein HYX51_04620 [Chloroflexi bacterium]|nr:hypothetical protein [Chloroflexota bacterium]
MNNQHHRPAPHGVSLHLPNRRRFLRSAALTGSALLLAAGGLSGGIAKASNRSQNGTLQLPGTEAGRRLTA